MTAAALAASVGQLPLDHLEVLDGCHHLLARALVELARSAKRLPLAGRDDALVVLVRALGRMAVLHPEATSVAAAHLLARLSGAPGISSRGWPSRA